MKTNRFLHALFVLLVLVWGSAVSAQTPTPAEEAKAQKLSITLENFPEQTEKLNALLDKAASSTRDIELADTRRRFNELSTKVEAAVIEAESMLDSTSTITSEEIDKIDLPLKSLRSEILSLSDSNGSRISQFSRLESDVQEQLIAWKDALERLSKNSESVAIQDRLKASVRDLADAEHTLESHLDDLVLIQTDLNQEASHVRDARQKLANAKGTFHNQLLVKESDPMYSSRFWHAATSVPWSSISHAFKEIRVNTETYLQANQDRFYIVILLSILIGLFFKAFGSSEFIKNAFKSLYDNPLLLSVLTSLFVARAIFYDGNADFFDTLKLLSIIPVLLFLRDVLGSRYTGVIVGVGVLYLVGEFVDVVRPHQALATLLLFLQLMLATYLANLFTQECACTSDAIDPEKPPGKLLTTFGHTGKVFVWIFSVVALLLFVGFYRLAVFVEDNLFSAIYGALFFFVLYRLAHGFIVAAIHSRVLQKLNVIRSNTQSLVKFTRSALILFVICAWIHTILDAFGVANVILDKIADVLTAGIQLGDIRVQVSGVILAIFFLVAGGRVSSAVRRVLEAEFYSRRKLDAGTRNTIDTGVHYIVLILSVLAAVGSLGIGLKNIAIIAGALSVGIGFGLQNIVNNFVSGIILLFERPIKIGDLVLVGGNTLGNVSRIGIRSSTIRTLDEAEIIIPNATLVTENVINWTLSSRRARIAIGVGVAYGTDVKHCMEVLLNAVSSCEFITEYPAPDILFRQFGDSSLNFEVRGWIKNVQDRPKLESQLMIAVHEALKESGISIPFPQRDLHIISMPEKKAENL